MQILAELLSPRGETTLNLFSLKLLFKMRASSNFQIKAEMLTQRRGASSKGQQEAQCELCARRVCTLLPPSFLATFTRNLAQKPTTCLAESSNIESQFSLWSHNQHFSGSLSGHELIHLVDLANLCFSSSTFIRSVLQLFQLVYSCSLVHCTLVVETSVLSAPAHGTVIL